MRVALEPAMVGRRFVRVLQRRADLRFPFPDRFVVRLEGQKIDGLRRRAKYLLIDLEGGETLIIHLGMSGRISVHPSKILTMTTKDAKARNKPSVEETWCGDTFEPHDHVVFFLDDATCIVFNDHRRFGMMDLTGTDKLEGYRFFARLGPEPLGNEFSEAHLDQVLAGKTTPIKAALLDQGIVAGLGNIYVCEALYRSGISPRRLARTIPGKRVTRLVPAIRNVLGEAIASGGSSLRDYAHTDGTPGYFQHAFSVYDRAGEACRTTGCKGIVRRIVQSGRSTFYCGNCQR